MRSSRVISFSACSRTASGMSASSSAFRYSSIADASSSPSSLRIDSICLRRKYSRRCFWAPGSTSARIVRGAGPDVVADPLAHLHLGQTLGLVVERRLEPLVHVERLEEVDLLFEGQGRRVAGGVGQGARLGDRAQEVRDPAVVAAVFEDLVDHCAVLTDEVACLAVDRDVVAVLLDVDEQEPLGVRVRRAGNAARLALEDGAADAARKANGAGDTSHRADLGELALVTGDQKDALFTVRIDGKRDVHRGEDDCVVERDEKKSAHYAESYQVVEQSTSPLNG